MMTQSDDVHMSMGGSSSDEQVVLETWKAFTDDDHETWQLLINNRRPALHSQAHALFLDGLEILGLDRDGGVPDMKQLNRVLHARTGWETVPVPGLIASKLFFDLMAERKFPVGNFIRDRSDLGYTPAPDIFHDAFGHLPFLVNKGYANFVEELGRAGGASRTDEELARFERIYWFTIEFGLVQTKNGMRIYGGGLLSSHDESAHALKDGAVEKRPYDLHAMATQAYHNNEMQSLLFVVDDVERVFRSAKDIKTVAEER
ncbi:MAG: phenylalanine 4-monooxygenase [Planctomycetes bacterium]|nr:phenylalanine 4-monooxygenase [Planctomycetota bacterium]NUQ34653.1 phenylalanine 4-monooxygenase [Planctomycetaceae bacterium]